MPPESKHVRKRGALTKLCFKHALGMDTGWAKHAGFQNYTVLKTVLVSAIPPIIPLSQAVKLPCALSTAAAKLFHRTALAMSKPSLNSETQNSSVFVWGGSSSVGSCAMQIARAAGYRVVSTASVRNFEYCKKLGAAIVVDYAGDRAEERALEGSKGRELVGVWDCIAKRISAT